MSTQQISVIILTHNPRLDYLAKVLGALEVQSLKRNEWELILVDNASDNLLSESVGLNWHPNARHVREEQLGLTAARLRGIQEAKGDILVFVDDDNVLRNDYLAIALGIAERFPFLGAFGGQVHAIYEISPPTKVIPFLHYLLDRRLSKARWGQDDDYHRFSPCGAGMVVTRKVAVRFQEKLMSDPRRMDLGRKGTQLFSGEDSDLAMCSHDLGMGNGVFPELVLDHLIPQSRLQPDFFVRVARAGAFSNILLRYLNGLSYMDAPIRMPTRIKISLQRLMASPLAREIESARALGCKEAFARIHEWEGG